MALTGLILGKGNRTRSGNRRWGEGRRRKGMGGEEGMGVQGKGEEGRGGSRLKTQT